MFGNNKNIIINNKKKKGAYLAKQKVLEISMNWSKNKSCDLSFVADVHGLAHILHVGCCQFINYCHLDVKNEHIPNLEERENINLFANNSRKIILESLNKYNTNSTLPIVATPHSYSDFYLLREAYAANPNFTTSHILMDDIYSTLQFRTKTISYLADKFSKLDLNKSGYIEYDEFCTAFGRDPYENSKQMKQFFGLFNTDNITVNKIGFNEFLVSVATCFMDDKIRDAVKIMFAAIRSEEDKQYILRDNILLTYQRNVDKNKFDEKEFGDRGYDEWIRKMKIFIHQIFGDGKKMKFEPFYQEIEKNRYQYMVQHYLQSILLIRLKVKLSKKDFQINDMDKIYINPINRFVRSSSIQSVVQ